MSLTTLEHTNAVFRAFADPTRLRILSLLVGRELCVCELCEALGMPQPKISRHLAILRRARLATVRREGRWSYYSLPRRPGELARSLLECVGNCLPEVEILERDRERLAAALGDDACRR